MPRGNWIKMPIAPAKEQVANKARWNESRSSDKADFFTFGYSGRKTEEILEALTQHGVRTVVDVRQNPVAMFRPELSKKRFAALLAGEGIGYAHVPALGVPREIRAKTVETGSRDVLWDWYDANVIAVLDVRGFLEGFEQPVALMCTEIDPGECHRHRLALALERQGHKGFDL